MNYKYYSWKNGIESVTTGHGEFFGSYPYLCTSTFTEDNELGSGAEFFTCPLDGLGDGIGCGYSNGSTRQAFSDPCGDGYGDGDRRNKTIQEACATLLIGEHHEAA